MALYGIGYLLDSLNLSTKQVGNYINVDRTLVSKWRSGKRKIDAKAVYFDKLLELLLLKNQESNIEILENIFKSTYDDFEAHKKEDVDYVKIFLKIFILNNGLPKGHINNLSMNKRFEYVASVPVYEGTSNKRTAYMQLLDIALHQKPGKIKIVFSGVFEHIMSDIAFREEWLQKLARLLDQGFAIDVYITTHNDTKLFIYFFPLLLNRNIQFFHFSIIFDEIMSCTLMLLEGKLAAYGFYQSTVDSYCNSVSVFTDPLSINTYTCIANNIHNRSSTILNSISSSAVIQNEIQLYDFVNLNKNLIKCNPSVYYGFMSSLLFMDEELYLELLKQSHVSDQQIEYECKQFKERLARIRRILEYSNMIHFYPLQLLTEVALKDSFTYEVISDYSFSRIKLIMTNQQFKRHMNYMADFLEARPSFYICLNPNVILTHSRSTHCLCKKNEYFYVFDNNSAPHSKMSCDINFINSVYGMFEQEYMLTAEEFKHKQYVAEFLRKL